MNFDLATQTISNSNVVTLNARVVDKLLRRSKRERYAFIRDFKTPRHTKRLCHLLQVSRSGFYKWKAWPHSKVAMKRQALAIEIRKIHQSISADYGGRRVCRELNRHGRRHSLWSVQQVMRDAGLSARRLPIRNVDKVQSVRFPRCEMQQDVHVDLIKRNFQTKMANSVWLIDVTTISTRQGQLYLAVVEDLCSRLIVGHAFASAVTPRLACKAIRLALLRRKPRPGLIVHCDSSMPFNEPEYDICLSRYGLRPSRGSEGCAANSPIESFFSTLKRERVNWDFYLTRVDARRSITDYIDRFYNAIRQHSALGYRSPQEFEIAMNFEAAQKGGGRV